MFRNLPVAMDLSPASICLLRCMGPLRSAGAESATLLHVMDVRNVGGLYISLKNLVEPLLKEKEKELGEMGFRKHPHLWKFGSPGAGQRSYPLRSNAGVAGTAAVAIRRIYGTFILRSATG